MLRKIIYTLLLLFSLSLCANAGKQLIELSNSAQISLLTNSPSNSEVFRLYGHTAIRVKDALKNIDLVFNYGVFDFDSPNFIYRFAKGETDYVLAGYDFRQYLLEYDYRRISVYEQIFNLTQDEKQKIWEALCINLLPQNRKYRYNFFFDNCSTRPRDIIEKNVSGKITYTSTNKHQTFRDLVHECVGREPWVKFGIDLVIGSGADSIISDRQKMFLPVYLENAYENSTITRHDSVTESFIKNEGYILDFRKDNYLPIDSNFAFPFIIISWGILLTTILFSIFTFRKKREIADKTFDFLLFFTYGVAGCIVAFLMFVSEHPCTNPNWNLVWLNPVQLIAAFLFFPKYFSKCIYYYHFINFVLLILFLICWFIIPQHLEIAFIPYILALCVRSGTNIVKYRKMKNSN